MNGGIYLAVALLLCLVRVPAVCGTFPTFDDDVGSCAKWYRCVYTNKKNRDRIILNLTDAIASGDPCTDFNYRFASAIAGLPEYDEDRCFDTEMRALVESASCDVELTDLPCHYLSHGVHISLTALFMMILGISGFCNAYQILYMVQTHRHAHIN